VYVIRSSDEVDDQIAQLPQDGAARFAELRAALELDPWAGDPYVRGKPDSAMRTRTFAAASGDGFVLYLVLDRDRLVDLLQIVWFD
jgi:hypothetical protein